MRNALAIANKEVRSYFVSPIAYVTLGSFALLNGYFFVVLLSAFVRQSMQIGQFGTPQALNVNQMLIRPLLQNTTVLILFLLPAITMRTFADEKRTGTIELLLTSPLRDAEITIGKYVGAMVLYGTMLAISLISIGILFLYGTPEWKPMVTGYIGLLLLGSCFISIGLFISTRTTNQIVAFMVTFCVFLLLWVITWMSSFVGPTLGRIAEYLSVIDHFDDFSKGVLDTSHLVYYVSFTTFGLFLTPKSIESERWRG